MNINNITEKPLGEDVRQELVEFEAASRTLLKLNASLVDPDAVVQAISRFTDGLLEAQAEEADNETITLLACLWGIQICRRLKWEWVELTVRGEMWYGIVSPKREYAIFPFVYLREVLTESGRENTTLLIYNMLKEDGFSPANAGSYHVLE